MDPGLPDLGRGILILREALDQPPGSPALGQRHLRCHPTQPRDTRGSARTRTRTWDTGGFRIGRIAPWSFAGKTNLELTGARGGGGRRRGRGGGASCLHHAPLQSLDPNFPAFCPIPESGSQFSRFFPHSGVWIPISRHFPPFWSLDPNFYRIFPHSGVWIPIFTEFCPILESGSQFPGVLPHSGVCIPPHPSLAAPPGTLREGTSFILGTTLRFYGICCGFWYQTHPGAPSKGGYLFFGGGFVNPRAKSMLGEEMGEIPEVGFSSGSFEPRAFFFFWVVTLFFIIIIIILKLGLSQTKRES
ncbi:uncharacterized protein LOC116455019 [Corvus moneduloides]|uniref:uncharacterized protein LOC116455019 n=1 Tax=Corvus moneduloides TaxID=1196302 RepID=UPI0013634D0A|nr:uncharacterized protein LOC116455019 [Corvus moneduloides]